MSSRRAVPNGQVVSATSLYLAMSRYDASSETSTTSARFDYCSSTICKSTTYTESSAKHFVASALLFQLLSPAPHSRAYLHAFTSLTSQLQ
jgi:hypothetical protein